MNVSGPSPSGARIGGDDLQHLVTWYWCVKALIPSSEVVGVSVEASHSGTFDDVVVRFRDGSFRRFQIKATVDARDPANVEWLCRLKPNGGLSILQGLYKSWVELGRPDDGVALITTRPIDPTDEVFAGLDRNNHLGGNLLRARRKQLIDARTALAIHLGQDADELCVFLSALAIHIGQTEAQWRERVDDVAAGAGLKSDDASRAVAVADIREWVKTTRDERDHADIDKMVQRLQLRAEDSRSVIAINSLVELPIRGDEVAVLNWTPLLRGSTPETRRGVIVADDWNGRMATDLSTLRNQLDENSLNRVLVRASMRLPAWFALGAALRDVGGFNVAMRSQGQTWVADANGLDKPPVRVLRDTDLGDGSELLLALSMSAEATNDIAALSSELVQIGRVITLTVGEGPERRLFNSAADTMAAAVAIRDWVRGNLMSASMIHLVIIGSAPFAFFLGHLWDRVPPTTTYEDLAPGYEAAFVIPPPAPS